MKRLFTILSITVLLSSCDSLLQVMEQSGGMSTGITETEAVSGLKAALEKGVDRGTSLLGQKDGFLKNELYKILIPEEAQKAEKTLRDMGLGSLADNAIEAMNRGAENATSQAGKVFVSAIRQMTITDAIEIVTGQDGAATDYLVRATSNELRTNFKPIIQQSLDQVGATKHWTEFATKYNSIPLVQKKIAVDLNAYVTEKAMTALFSRIREEESLIRKNPEERTSAILKKVFNYADTH
ncbi:MAG: DUF4197 domain-containing protein [Flavobacteriales bacterium]|nr:DUF4197 domain-containing protein [Flavobacteriales bacterium]